MSLRLFNSQPQTHRLLRLDRRHKIGEGARCAGDGIKFHVVVHWRPPWLVAVHPPP